MRSMQYFDRRLHCRQADTVSGHDWYPEQSKYHMLNSHETDVPGRTLLLAIDARIAVDAQIAPVRP